MSESIEYGICADAHLHNWTAFASHEADSTNTRLKIQLAELERAAQETVDAGGKRLVIAGDFFHVRGSVAPSVLNPALETLKRIAAKVEVIVLAGNHDLEHRKADTIGNAVRALDMFGVSVIDTPRWVQELKLAFVPWVEKVDDLRNIIADLAVKISEVGGDPSSVDLILHAPIDGVIERLPEHDLTVEELEDLPFKRVFAGHYHHHKVMGRHNKVISVGALTHHTWSDVGSKAGFLLVGENEVTYRASRAPNFIDATAANTEDELALLADGNYVRARITSSKVEDVEAMRSFLTKAGARGVTIQTVKTARVTRAEGKGTASIEAGASIEVSVAEFVKSKDYPSAEEVIRQSLEVLASAGV